MFDTNTVFIIGAGASKEGGLPIGSELTGKIASLVDLHRSYNVEKGDYEIFSALQTLSAKDDRFKKNRFVASGRAVAESMQLALSIDTFLESHASNSEFVEIGKLGIVRAIQIEEQKSLLAPTQKGGKPFNINKLSSTWYYSLARQLFTGVAVENPESSFNNVSFIVFNYDRCLECFLLHALQIYFRINEAQANDILSNVRILHPYGSLGDVLPGSDHIPFAPQGLDLVAASKRIKTFSESAESAVIHTAREWIDRAETLVFLGFGFHEQNMDLLQPENVYLSDTSPPFRFNAYATTFGLSESDAAVVRDHISYLRTGGPYDSVYPWIKTLDASCSDLFAGFWRSMTK